MTTLKVGSIEHPTSGSNVTINGITPASTNSLGLRNLIINGAMQVAQRGTSVATSDGTNEGYQTVDRFGWYFSNSAGGAATVSQSTTVPDGQGFSNSFKIDVTTAHTPTTNQQTYIRYHVEAQDIRNSGWNYTDSTSNITLSFWARSTKAGTYCLWFRLDDSSPTQYYTHEYSLTANTWEKITVSLPGVSGAAINNDNGIGFSIYWILNIGPDRDGATAGSWYTTTGVIATDNQVNFFDSTDNEFYITGVQLEVGSVATPFEHRSYGDELRRCERYFQIIKAIQAMSGGSSTIVTASINLRTEMRSIPTWEQTGAFTFERSFYGGTTQTSASVTVYSAGSNTPYGSYLRFNNIPPTLPDNVGYYLNDSTDYLTASAEL